MIVERAISEKNGMCAYSVAVPRSHCRTFVQWSICLLIAAVMLETWLAQGVVVPCRVVGGSMAPGLLGTHREVVCADCGYRFACGTDVPLAAGRAVCPNCGCAGNEIQRLADVAGQRLLVVPEAFVFRQPRRWEVVALRRPTSADQIVLKRVVGLPGETVEIRHGDVYIDGRLERKDLAQQRALAVPVHAAACVLTTQLPRWRGERSNGGWRPGDGVFAHPLRSNEAIDWLVYHHSSESPVTDVDSYDPSRVRRHEAIHAVADLMLSLRVHREKGNGTFILRLADGSSQFEARLQFRPDRVRHQVIRDGQPMAGSEGSIADVGRERRIEVSLFDSQFLLAIDGRTLVRQPYERPEPPGAPPSSPAAIGVRGLAVTVSDLRLWRDVYYGEPIGRVKAGPVRLGPSEYFLLGDNSPIAEDSRYWPDRGAVDANLLVGKVLGM